MPATPTQSDDLLLGTSGSDTIDGLGGHDEILGWEGADALLGGEGRDAINGGSGNDTLRGGGDDDTLWGGEGDDSLNGGAGSDMLYGGAGNDALANDGTDSDGTEMYGGEGNDLLQVTSGFADGGAGNDTLTALDQSSQGSYSHLSGATGDDTLVGGAGGDVLDGGAGSDILEGGAGDDRLAGGSDGHWEEAHDENGERYQRFHPSLGNETLSGGAGNDILESGGGADRLYGGAGNDVLFAAGGNDTLSGGDGDDSLNGWHGDDSLDGGAGDDVLYGGDDDVRRVEGHDENGEPHGTYLTVPGNETLSGGAGNDRLYAGGGADRLDGGNGRDGLQGGAGADTLTGGHGADEFRGTLSSLNGDRITDYASGERIYLEGSLISAGQVRLMGAANGLDTELQVDGNNDGTFETVITLAGRTSGELVVSSQDGLTNNVIRIGQPVNEAPILDPIAPQGRAEDAGPWSFQVPAATDSDSANLTYAATLANGGALPSWLSFDAATLTFSGTPPEDFNGTIGLRVTVSDGALSASQGFDLVVAAVNDAPVLAPIAPQSRMEDAGPWSFQVPAATDVDSTSLTYAAALSNGAALPAWLSFDAATRTFSGTPPADFNGTVGLRVTASDGTISTSQGFDLVVTAVNDAPTDLSLGASSVGEFAANGTVVGTLSARDVDSSSFTYTLLDGAGGHFALSGSQLVVADGLLLDFEQQASHVVQVRVSDGQGGAWTESLTIDLANTDPEVIIGDARANTFAGGLGGDVLNGGAGNDRLSGGAGNDTYVVQAGDVVTELAGNGTADLVQSASSWTLGAHFENLELTGGAGLTGTGNELANRITGNSGHNALHGGGGNDALVGGAGDDTLNGGAGNDSLFGGAGHDTLDGGTGTDRLEGGAGNDTYVLAATSDTVVEAASGGTDQIKAAVSVTLAGQVENLVLTGSAAINGTGNSLANRITGNSGSNSLSGGHGADVLTGGAGADDFVFSAAGESGLGAGRDVVRDFARGQDDIALSALDADATRSGNQAFRLDAGGAFSAGEIRQAQKGAHLLIELNTDGDAAAEMSILLSNVTGPLGANDFLL